MGCLSAHRIRLKLVPQKNPRFVTLLSLHMCFARLLYMFSFSDGGLVACVGFAFSPVSIHAMWFHSKIFCLLVLLGVVCELLGARLSVVTEVQAG